MSSLELMEIEVLKTLAGEASNCRPGAAFNAAAEWLREKGYVVRVDGQLGLTERGRQALQEAKNGAAEWARSILPDLTDEDREWIDGRAAELFRASERQRGRYRHATIVAEDFHEFFVVSATWDLARARLAAIGHTARQEPTAAANHPATAAIVELAAEKEE